MDAIKPPRALASGEHVTVVIEGILSASWLEGMPLTLARADENLLVVPPRYIQELVTAAKAKKLKTRNAELQAEVECLRLKVKGLNRTLGQQRAEMNDREHRASQRITEARRIEREAEGWRLAAESYSRQAGILRDQLVAAGITPDRRAS